MYEVEIIIVVELVPISALYYRLNTISILQDRKLVEQVTSTNKQLNKVINALFNCIFCFPR